MEILLIKALMKLIIFHLEWNLLLGKILIYLEIIFHLVNYLFKEILLIELNIFLNLYLIFMIVKGILFEEF